MDKRSIAFTIAVQIDLSGQWSHREYCFIENTILLTRLCIFLHVKNTYNIIYTLITRITQGHTLNTGVVCPKMTDLHFLPETSHRVFHRPRRTLTLLFSISRSPMAKI